MCNSLRHTGERVVETAETFLETKKLHLSFRGNGCVIVCATQGRGEWKLFQLFCAHYHKTILKLHLSSFSKLVVDVS